MRHARVVNAECGGADRRCDGCFAPRGTLHSPGCTTHAQYVKDRWLREAEDQIYVLQAEYIRQHFGKKAEDLANYGQSVIGDEDTVDVTTRVYGHGILRSVAQYSTFTITHDFED